MGRKKVIDIKRISPEELDKFAEEVFDGKWICISKDRADNEPWVGIHLSLFHEKYEVADPDKVMLWFENRIGGRGYLQGDMKLIHIDDHNEVARRIKEARKVVLGG